MFKLLFVTALVVISAAEDVELDEGVLVLTSDNFDGVLKDNELVLVEFYAPWCGHCKNLAPHYAEAAQQLAEEGSEIKLGKVDATIHKDLGTKFGVRGYPTLKWFRDGVPTDYSGGRTKETIVAWLKKKSGPPAVAIAAKEDMEKLLKENIAVVGYFADLESDEAKAFTKAAGQNDEIMFGICSDEALMKEFEIVKEGVVLFKSFDDKRADKTEELTDVESIAKFVSVASTPLLTEFSQQAAGKLFANKEVPFLFLAMSKTGDADLYESTTESVRTIAKEAEGAVVAVHLNTDDKSASQVLNYLDLKEDDYPTYRILNLEKGLKYKPEESDLSKIGEFVAAFQAGDLKPFLKAQDVPEDWDKEPVKVLTGKNFKEVAFDQDKNVFVEFYAPWCGHCKKLVPIWDELAQKYAGADNVVIAKMDSTLNEVEEVSIKGFPTLKFFPAGSDEIVEYSGDRSLDDLLKYLGKYVELPEEKAVEDEPAAPEDVAEEKKKDEL